VRSCGVQGLTKAYTHVILSARSPLTAFTQRLRAKVLLTRPAAILSCEPPLRRFHWPDSCPYLLYTYYRPPPATQRPRACCCPAAHRSQLGPQQPTRLACPATPSPGYHVTSRTSYAQQGATSGSVGQPHARAGCESVTRAWPAGAGDLHTGTGVAFGVQPSALRARAQQQPCSQALASCGWPLGRIHKAPVAVGMILFCEPWPAAALPFPRVRFSRLGRTRTQGCPTALSSSPRRYSHGPPFRVFFRRRWR